MAEEKKPEVTSKPDAVPAPARRYVDVEIVSVEGYVKGARTTLHVARAEELVKAGKAKLVGESSDKANKKAPAANQK